MDSSVWFVLATVFTATLAYPKDQEPRKLEEKSLPSPSTTPQPQAQRRYETKEVILYLTPTQIRELESGKSLISAQNIAQPHYSIGNQQHNNQQQQFIQDQNQLIQNIYEEAELNKQQEIELQQAYNVHNQQQQELLSQNVHIPQVEEPNTEKDFIYAPQFQLSQKPAQLHVISPLITQPQLAHSYSYINYSPQEQTESGGNAQLFYPEPPNNKQIKQLQLQQLKNIEIQTDSLLYQKHPLIPYNYASLYRQEIRQLEEEKLQNEIRQQLAKKLQLRPFIPSPLKLGLEEHISKLNSQQNWIPIEPKLQLQYASKYNHGKYFTNIENFLRNIQIQKQNALARAEAIAKSPPLLVNKDISIIKRRPVHIVKHVKVPVPAPFLVSVPKPFEVKVPQPYPVPLEIIRPIPIPIVKTENVEIEKPVPIEVEKRIPVPVEKKVYVKVNKPYTVERIVPYDVKQEIPVKIPIYKSEKLRILRHVWEH